MNRLVNILKNALDEAHEQAALGLFLTALGLELWTPFDDYATLGVLSLAMVTLLGSKRYRGFTLPGRPVDLDLSGLNDDDDLEDPE